MKIIFLALLFVAQSAFAQTIADGTYRLTKKVSVPREVYGTTYDYGCPTKLSVENGQSGVVLSELVDTPWFEAIYFTQINRGQQCSKDSSGDAPFGSWYCHKALESAAGLKLETCQQDTFKCSKPSQTWTVKASGRNFELGYTCANEYCAKSASCRYQKE